LPAAAFNLKTKTMKSISVFLLASALVLGLSMQASAQKGAKAFSGVIQYDITYPESGELDPAMSGQLPTAMTIEIFGHLSKTSMQMGMISQASIVDAKDKKSIALLDVMGQRFAIKQSAEEIDKQMAEMPKTTIKQIDETKEIAGYKCKKAEITSEEDENPIIVYYTTDINGDYDNWGSGGGVFKGINGQLMEYELNQNGIKMRFTAKSVTEKKFKEKDFLMPADYQEVTPEELRKMFGGE
jgi:GLPGLI family protein